MTISFSLLDRNGVIAYVGQHAKDYGLDPAAVLAVANHEGLNTAPGSSWKLPGEPKISFGPPSWYAGGAGSGFLGKFGDVAAAWTPAGIDYWLQQVATSKTSNGTSPVGLTGESAIAAIVHAFERPRADLAPGEITNALHDYNTMQAAVGGSTIVGPSPVPGSQNDPAPAVPFDPTIPAIPLQGTTTAGVLPNGVKAGQIGPFPINIPSGLVLAVLGALLLLIGAILFAFNVKVQQPTINVSTPQVST